MQFFLKGGMLLQIMFCIVMLVSIWTNITIYTILLFSICILLYVPILKYLDKTAIFISLFSLTYCLIQLFHDVISWANLISYFMCPTLFYCFGKYIVVKANGDVNKLTTFLCVSILLFSIVLYISAAQDIIHNGFVNISRTFHIWGSASEAGGLSATLYGLNASLGLVGLPFYFAQPKINKTIKYIFLLLTILSLITVIHLVNRTGIVVLILCFVVVAFYRSNGNIFRFLILCAIIAIITLILTQLNVINTDVFDAYLMRDDDVGAVNTAGGRLDKWVIGFHNIFRYPFGWEFTSIKYGYAHNLWIDIARISGIIPFTLFLIATILAFNTLRKLLKYRELILLPLLLGLNVCFFFSSFVEPVIEAMPLYFYLYIMLWGIQNQLLAKFKSYCYNH